ncbi:hypothetical protein MCUN1_001447 [Malassezia cuniculi]|uniref:Uncharacterized protein n=1 Tax=Malassezia cuniculi TaxID=948313 RepID=A0AAF0JAS4_9BASI|nr:hypothetical protein MCUN1_001447 [Malassezia cuniculi]
MSDKQNRLVPRVYKLNGDIGYLACVHVKKEDITDALYRVLQDDFNDTLEQGRTYPQYGPLDHDEFASVFLLYDAVVGVIVHGSYGDDPNGIEAPGVLGDAPLKEALARFASPEHVGGFYYVKPNYPGRQRV